MDVNMLGQDGFKLATEIRQHPRFQNIAIIFISGIHLTDADRLSGYQHGAMDYISVPIIPELLRAKVGPYMNFTDWVDLDPNQQHFIQRRPRSLRQIVRAALDYRAPNDFAETRV